MKTQEPLIPYRIKNKWGLVNKSKEIIVPCIYEKVEPFYKGFAEITLSYKNIGILDLTGNVVIPPIYASISIVEDETIFIVENKDQKYGLYKNGKLIFDGIYDYIYYKSEDNILVCNCRKWNFVNLNNKILFPEIELQSYSNLSPYFYSLQGSIKLIDERIIIHEYFGIHVFIDGIEKDIKYNLKEISEFKTKNANFYYSFRYSEHYRGEECESLIFYDAEFNLLYPNENLKSLNIEKLITKHEENDYIIVEDDKQQSYLLDENFKLIKKLKFRVIGDFYENLAIIEQTIDGKTGRGFINRDFQIEIPCIYHHVENFKNGLCKVRQNRLYGMINRKSELIIPFMYHNMGTISDNKVAVTFADNYFKPCGFIDLNNNLISKKDYVFYYGGPYFNKWGVAVVQKPEKGFGLINRSGIEILECKYFIDATTFIDGYAIFSENEKYGILNYNGEIIIAPKYNMIYSVSIIEWGDSIFWRVLSGDNDEFFGYIDNTGNEFWEGSFD